MPPQLSRWCAAGTIEVDILREDYETWDTVPSSGHDWCQNERWHDEYHGKDPGCCAGPEERESWACECSCHTGTLSPPPEEADMTGPSRTEFDTRAELMANQDDCLLAIEDGIPVPAAKLGKLPPWRAVAVARIAARAGVPLERGTVGQLEAEARAVGGAGTLGEWWNRADSE